MQYTIEGDTLSSADGGTSWRTVLRNDTLLLAGLENRHTLMVYDEPLPLLRYPFSYGDSVRGRFRGLGVWCDRTYMCVWGDGVTRADGEGTLILPTGDTLRHALRVHSIRRSWHTAFDSVRTWHSLHEKARKEATAGMAPDTAMTVPVVSETFAWFAPGWRYPVMRMEHADDGMEAATLAVTYPPESQLELAYDLENALLRQRTGMGGGQEQPGGRDDASGAMASHAADYDSSTGTVTVSFSLSRPATVSLLLSDAAGIAWRSAERSYGSGGSYALPLSCTGLPHGQYALRVTCGGSVFTERFSIM